MEIRTYTSARLATMDPGQSGYGLIEDGAVVCGDSAIVWAGPQNAIPAEFATIPATGFGDRLITPALIDCHTHIVHGGNRAAEFEQRLEGASYEAIARAGGGIVSTVRATRAASEDQLRQSALTRLDALLADGVGTVEVKSGYGLDLETELRMLRVARSLPDHRPVRVRTSFLGAHAVPPEFAGDPDGYIDCVCNKVLPTVAEAGLADAVDGFCETIAFTPAQIERVFETAASLRLPVKLHAEQLSDQGGAALAARHGALSADHLEYLGQNGVAAMAEAGTVAVLLPGAFYTLRETQAPPVEALREAGVPMAVATDCNPGSSPLVSLLLAMNMACTLFRMTPLEALTGVTRNAARALGLGGGVGTIVPDAPADLAVWNVTEPAELAYGIGGRPLHARIHGGRLV